MFTVNHCYLLVHRVLLPVVIYLYTEFYYLLLFTCTQSFITCCYLLVHRVLLPVVIYLYTEFYYLLLFTCTQSFITCCYLLVHRVLLPVVIYLYTEFYYLLLFTCTQSFITWSCNSCTINMCHLRMRSFFYYNMSSVWQSIIIRG